MRAMTMCLLLLTTLSGGISCTSAESAGDADTGSSDPLSDAGSQSTAFVNRPCREADTFVGRHGQLQVRDGVLQNECGHPIHSKG